MSDVEEQGLDSGDHVQDNSETTEKPNVDANVTQSDSGSAVSTADTMTDRLRGCSASIEQSIIGLWGGPTKHAEDAYQDPKYQFPYGFVFILIAQMLERFTSHSFKALLLIYFIDWLGFGHDNATVSFHAFYIVSYLSPMFLSVVVDGYLGKYKGMLYCLGIGSLGVVLMSLTALPPPFWLGPAISLFLIAVSLGGIEGIFAALGGDQVAECSEAEQRRFFSFFYIFLKLGGLLAVIIFPIIRSEVSCFGSDCFPLAFGVSSMSILLATGVFFAGTNFYTLYPPSDSLVRKTCGAVCKGMAMKVAGKEKEHWLDNAASADYEQSFVDEIKSVLKLLLLFAPLPMFWTLYEQSGSRWILQGRSMDGLVSDSLSIPPDMMLAFGPLLTIVLIPVFDGIILPLCDRFNFLTKPLQRMGCGMVLAAVSFFLAAAVQYPLQEEFTTAPQGLRARMEVINVCPCWAYMSSKWLNTSIETGRRMKRSGLLPDEELVEFERLWLPDFPCNRKVEEVWTKLHMPKGSSTIVVLADNGERGLTVYDNKIPVRKLTNGKALVGIFYAVPFLPDDDQVVLYNDNIQTNYHINETGMISFDEVKPGNYSIMMAIEGNVTDVQSEVEISVRGGGIYTIVVYPNGETLNNTMMARLVTNTPANNLSLLWQIPQYIVMSCGEIMFGITGFAFAYTQAPSSMKTVVQALWLSTVGTGNGIAALITGAIEIKTQFWEFIVFAILMLVTCLIFAIIAYNYEYVHFEREYELAEGKNKESKEDGEGESASAAE